MRIQSINRRRGGATTVEFAFVAILLFMMLFSIFEYGRFLFVHHLATNAARDGARFASVRTGGGTIAYDGTLEPASITVADIQGVVLTGNFNGKAYGTGMLGLQGNITGYTCDVYSITDADLYSTPPNLTPAGKPAWNAGSFSQKIVVRISGSYQPVVPNLIGLSSSIPFTVYAFAGSEAN